MNHEEFDDSVPPACDPEVWETMNDLQKAQVCAVLERAHADAFRDLQLVRAEDVLLANVHKECVERFERRRRAYSSRSAGRDAR